MFLNIKEALEWIHTRRGNGPKPGNNRMEWIMGKLDHPERKIKAIHIAGTNGKGSTVAYLTSLFLTSGYTVGSFTSPHIMKFNERISMNGTPISDEEVVQLANQILPLYEEAAQMEWGGLTEFEVITTMMFLHFAAVQPDVVLLEVGLGGLYDSTNVVLPALSVITTIGLDHLKILGDTVEEIAFQKAGIIKKDVPVILGNIHNAAKAVLLKIAAEKNAPTKCFGEHFRIGDPQFGEDFQERFDFISPDLILRKLQIQLIGQHQIENAAVALQAFRCFCESTGFSYTEQKMREGLAAAFWPVRLEIMSRHPFIILDGAHNEPAMEVLVKALKEHFSGKKIKILYASLTTKELEKIGPWLEKIPDSEIHLTTFDFPKAAKLDELRARLQVQQAIGHSDWKTALEELSSRQGENEILLVTGSLYFLSDVRRYLFDSGKVEKNQK